MKRNSFHPSFHEGLTGLANAIYDKTKGTAPPLSVAKDVPAIMGKRAAKNKRRAEAARKAGLL